MLRCLKLIRKFPNLLKNSSQQGAALGSSSCFLNTHHLVFRGWFFPVVFAARPQTGLKSKVADHKVKVNANPTRSSDLSDLSAHISRWLNWSLPIFLFKISNRVSYLSCPQLLNIYKLLQNPPTAPSLFSMLCLTGCPSCLLCTEWFLLWLLLLCLLPVMKGREICSSRTEASKLLLMEIPIFFWLKCS